MKNIYKFIIYVMSISAFAMVCKAQSDADVNIKSKTSYYWYKGEKIPLVEESASKAQVAVLNSGNVKILDETEAKLVKEGRTSSKYSGKTYLLKKYSTEEGKELQSSPYLYIKLKKDEDKDLMLKYCTEYNLVDMGYDKRMPLWYIVHVSPESQFSALEVSNILYETGDFACVSADFLNTVEPNISFDEYTDRQWGLCNNYIPYADISAPEAWNLATGRQVKLAIFDNPFLYKYQNHPELTPNYWEGSFNIHTNSSPAAYIDDDSTYPESHGLNVASIAGACRNNKLGISGLAPDCKLVSISVDFRRGSDPVTINEYVNGFLWAMDRVDVISCSWSSNYKSEYLEETIKHVASCGRGGLGCTIVFSAGNEGINHVGYPACIGDCVLSVGAYDYTGQRWKDSNYGDGLDVVAPGVDIMVVERGDYLTEEGYRQKFTGTSAAAPFVSGTVALMLEADPTLKSSEIIDIIKRTTYVNYEIPDNVNLNDLEKNYEYGYGPINAYQAVKRVIERKLNK